MSQGRVMYGLRLNATRLDDGSNQGAEGQSIKVAGIPIQRKESAPQLICTQKKKKCLEEMITPKLKHFLIQIMTAAKRQPNEALDLSTKSIPVFKQKIQELIEKYGTLIKENEEKKSSGIEFLPPLSDNSQELQVSEEKDMKEDEDKNLSFEITFDFDYIEIVKKKPEEKTLHEDLPITREFFSVPIDDPEGVGIVIDESQMVVPQEEKKPQEKKITDINTFLQQKELVDVMKQPFLITERAEEKLLTDFEKILNKLILAKEDKAGKIETLWHKRSDSSQSDSSKEDRFFPFSFSFYGSPPKSSSPYSTLSRLNSSLADLSTFTNDKEGKKDKEDKGKPLHVSWGGY